MIGVSSRFFCSVVDSVERINQQNDENDTVQNEDNENHGVLRDWNKEKPTPEITMYAQRKTMKKEQSKPGGRISLMRSMCLDWSKFPSAKTNS